MNIVVVGGTGFIGTALCSELADRDHDVIALSRSPESTTHPVETAMGDVTVYNSIEPAFENQDVVVNLVALSPLFKPRGGNDRHFDVHLRGTENVIAAAEEHDIDRLVQMSALGADPNAETAFLKTKGMAEERVRESSCEAVLMRPSIVFGEGGEFVPFMKLLSTPVVTGLPSGGTTRFQPIWIGDLVGILADATCDESYSGVYEIGGPDIRSLAEITRVLHEANGRSVRILPIPMTLVDLGLTVLGWIPGAPMGKDQARALRMDNVPAENDIGEFGVDPTDLLTIEAYLESKEIPDRSS